MAIPALATWNVGLDVYVDGAVGVSGDGSIGSPWKTLQNAADALAASVTWPTNQDVRVNIVAGTYQAASGTATVATNFTNSSRGTNANRRLIWVPKTGSEGAVFVKSPPGTTGSKGCFMPGTNALNGRQTWWDIDFDGESTPKGASGNGNSFGWYLQGSAADSNTAMEMVFCGLHGIQVTGSAGQCSAQGVTMEDGGSEFKAYYNEVYSIGLRDGQHTAGQEHAFYLHRTAYIIGNVIRNMPNGFGVQFYNGTNTNTYNGSNVSCNTFYDMSDTSGTGGGAITFHGSSSNITCANNIIKNCAVKAAITFYPAGSGASGSVIANNLYHSCPGGNVSGLPSGWTHTGAVTSDPLFVNAAGNDFHLQSGSPAIGAADTGNIPTGSIDGVARVNDIGAYEYSAGASGVTYEKTGKIIAGP